MTSLPSSSAAPDVARLVASAADREADAKAEAYERTHVHGVYQAIAPHFSATRHKPWPAVASFLHAQYPGSVGLDVGCGNGKYLGVNPAVYIMGSDRSAALVALAMSRLGRSGDTGVQGATKMQSEAMTAYAPKPSAAAAAAGGTEDSTQPGGAPISDVLVADGLSLPFRDGTVDFAICVAVVHHMSTRARRQDAIKQLLRCVKTREGATGHVLVYVWALEQGESRRGWDEGGEQDLLVPWVLKTQTPRAKKKGPRGPKANKDNAPVAAAGGEASATAAPTAPPEEGTETAGGAKDNDPVFKRYYHLYRKGELEEDVLAAGGVVITSGYERDNWWAVAANGTSS